VLTTIVAEQFPIIQARFRVAIQIASQSFATQGTDQAAFEVLRGNECQDAPAFSPQVFDEHRGFMAHCAQSGVEAMSGNRSPPPYIVRAHMHNPHG
jgi:hypothetical protein